MTEYTYHETYRLPVRTVQKYRYDDAGNSLVSTVSYNSFGSVLSKTDFNGNTVTYTYSSLYKAIPETETYSYPSTAQTKRIEHILANYLIIQTVTTYPDGTKDLVYYTHETNLYPNSLSQIDYFTYKNAAYYILNTVGIITTVSETEITEVTKAYASDTSSAYIQTSKVYDFNTGLLKSETDGEGLTTSYAYNPQFFDKLSVITKPDLNQTKYFYNIGSENSLVILYNNKYYTKDVMDSLGRKTHSCDGEYSLSGGYGSPRLLETYQYSNNLNNISCVTDALGNNTYYYYSDLYNRATSTMQYDGNVNIINRIEFDDVNRTKTVYNPENEYFIYKYDINNNLVKKYTLQVGGEANPWQETYSYDVFGNMLTQTDANGNTTSYTYNGRSQLVSCKNAQNQTTSYEYDGFGNLNKVIYPNNTSVEYLYDTYGRLTRTKNQLGQYEYYTYDNAGNIKTYTDRKGTSTYYTYMYEQTGEPMSYLVKYKLTDSAENKRSGIKYEYDVFGNLTKESHVSQSCINDIWQTPAHVLREYFVYTYTFDNRLASEDHVIFDYKYTTEYVKNTNSYTYDANGNILSDPNGSYAYDALGRLTEHKIEGSVYGTYLYNKDGTLCFADLSNGLLYFSYDSLNRLTNRYHDVTSSTSACCILSYDRAGNITSETSGTELYMWSDEDQMSYTEYVTETASYTYDALNRISTETNSDKTTYYTYDTMGNISYQSYSYPASQNVAVNYDGSQYSYDGQTLTGHYKTFAYDNANKLTSAEEWVWYDDDEQGLECGESFPYTYTYDVNGNLTQKTLNSSVYYEYNEINQLICFTDTNGVKTNYAYYPNGLRCFKYADNYVPETKTGAYSEYLYDKNGKMLYDWRQNSSNEYSSSGYKWGLLGLARISYHSGSSHTYEYPITNYRGDIVSHFADYKNYYDAYGNERRTPSGSSPFGYCGEYKDEESGLIYLRNRYYDPSIGRFISEDKYWTADNCIYGDEKDISVRHTIIGDKKVYYDINHNVTKTEDFNFYPEKANALYGKEISDDTERKNPDVNTIVQAGNLYVYCMGNPIKHCDSSGLSVSGIGISAYVAFGIRIDIQGFYVWDDKGNHGIILIGGGGGGFPNSGVSGSSFYSHYTDTIFDLEGIGMSTGGGFSYFSADFNSNLSGTVSVGSSVFPVDAHGIVTFGKIILSW